MGRIGVVAWAGRGDKRVKVVGSVQLRGLSLPVFAVVVAWGAAPMSPAHADCERSAFETAVEEAATALRHLHAEMRPPYQAKLQELKAKRKWTADQLMREAQPLVQDDKITGFDDAAQEQLSRIESLGSDGAKAEKPDCAMLGVLREHMANLVTIQRQKWQYMVQKIDSELKR